MRTSIVLAAGLTLNVIANIIAATAGSLDITTAPGRFAHILPSTRTPASGGGGATPATGGGQLTCHAPCQIMGRLNLYEIFASPAALQDGSPASFSSAYQPLLARLGQDFAGQPLLQIATQYYNPTTPTGKQYIKNVPGVANATSLAGTYVDPTPFPLSNGCNDSDVPNGAVNCINDTQIQTAIQNAMAKNGWITGPNHAFLYVLPKNEGNCFPFSSSCAYTTYCGYHSFLTLPSGAQLIYAVIPYAIPAICVHSAGASPNGDPVADQAAAATAHEIMEMVARPIPSGGTGWFDSVGNEIMDKCIVDPPSAVFGQNTYAGSANQLWNGNPYELPMAWNNHAIVSGVPDVGACDQSGPISYH